MASLLFLVCCWAGQSSESHLEGHVESLKWPSVLPLKGWPWWSGHENTGSCGQRDLFPVLSSSAVEFCFHPPALQCRILFCLHPQLCSALRGHPIGEQRVFWSEWEPVWLSLWNYWGMQKLLIDRHGIREHPRPQAQHRNACTGKRETTTDSTYSLHLALDWGNPNTRARKKCFQSLSFILLSFLDFISLSFGFICYSSIYFVLLFW